LCGTFEQILVANEAAGIAGYRTIYKVVPQTGGEPFFHRSSFFTKIGVYAKYLVLWFEPKVYVP
jgi:hypothetical protein